MARRAFKFWVRTRHPPGLFYGQQAYSLRPRIEQPGRHLQLARVEADEAVALVLDVGGLGVVDVARDGAGAQLALEVADAVGAGLGILRAAVVREAEAAPVACN